MVATQPGLHARSAPAVGCFPVLSMTRLPADASTADMHGGRRRDPTRQGTPHNLPDHGHRHRQSGNPPPRRRAQSHTADEGRHATNRQVAERVSRLRVQADRGLPERRHMDMPAMRHRLHRRPHHHERNDLMGHSHSHRAKVGPPRRQRRRTRRTTPTENDGSLLDSTRPTLAYASRTMYGLGGFSADQPASHEVSKNYLDPARQTLAYARTTAHEVSGREGGGGHGV